MVRNPWLIQRCTITNYAPVEGQSFSDCIKCDYMGSSEFEWGIIPETISALNAKSHKLKVFKYAGKAALFFLCLPEQADAYQVVLEQLLARKIQTKEYVFSSEKSGATLWIDLDNQVVFSTSEKMLQKLPKLLAESQKKIERNQKIKAASDEVYQKLKLNDLKTVLPGTVAICGTGIDDCEGTKALKGTTDYDVVYWLNGPYVNGCWICGYYTAESIQEYIKTQTGAIAERIKESKAVKRAG